MSIEKCLENEHLSGKLGIVGFLSQYGRLAYRRFSGVDFYDVAEDRISAIIYGAITDDRYERLKMELYTTVTTLKCRNPWVTFLAIATPALDLGSSIPGLKVISPVGAIVSHCLTVGAKHIGLLGTEWDTAKDSPLAVALAQCGIQVYEPQEKERRHALSACVLDALRGSVRYNDKDVSMIDFCLDTVNQMLYESVGLMDVLVLCNPELRQLRPSLANMFIRKREFVPVLQVVDVTDIYWPTIDKAISQSQEKPSG